MKRITTALLAIAVAAMAMTPTLSNAQPGGRGKSLAPEAREALIEALAGPDGEYAAHALYSAIITKFGEVQPYVNIRQAESRHIAALERQLEKYSVPPPTNAYAGKVTAPVSLLVAAQDGVKAEEKNIALYDRLLTKVTDYPDLTQVLKNLQRASRDNHLPALRAAGKSNSPAAVQSTPAIVADEFLRSFGPTGAEEQSRLGKATQAMRAENYSTAVVVLQKLVAEGHLTPKQEELVTGMVAKLQKAKPEKP